MSRTFSHRPVHAPAHPVTSPRYPSAYGRTRWQERAISDALTNLNELGYFALDAVEREIVDALLGTEAR